MREVFTSSDHAAIWVENPYAVEEEAYCSLQCFTHDSMMPGDTLTISTPMYGVGNMGTWKIVSALYDTFVVDISTRVPAIYSSSVAMIGSNLSLFRLMDGTPMSLFKKLMAVVPNGKYADLKFTDNCMYSAISAAAGSVISPCDKLGFDTHLAQGVDGYAHNTGLIAEANRVLQGDMSDPDAYPGVVAAGADVGVSAALIKRITCSFNLRVRSGISTSDIADRVRSAVASVVNATGVGKSVAISALVTAAGKVNGVLAVSVLSPTYNSSNDVISVQAFEKPMVLNLTQDIAITFAGV